jgi:acyl-CoA thioester hydrolase
LRDDHDLVFAVREVRIDFHRPARLDDALQVTAWVHRCRRASTVYAQEIRRDDEVLVAAEVRVAALNAGDFRPRAIPEDLYERLKSLETNAE